MSTSSHIRDLLHLQPNPAEGGFFVSTYTSPLASAIFYFLDPGTFSALHRVKGDMIYHFYSGHPVQMLLLRAPDAPKIYTFGNNLDKHELPMKVIPGGTWLGSRLLPGAGSHSHPGGDYALMGVTMAPAFDPANYSIAKRDDLLKEYRDEKIKELIIALTRS
jgi:predicted cupin superfamily sugar epimerase